MRWSPAHWSITARITGAAILLTVAAVLIVSTFGIRRERETLEVVTLKSLQRIASMTGDRLDELVRKTEWDTLALSRNASVEELCTGSGSVERATRQLAATVDSDPTLSWALVADLEGNILASKPPLAAPPNLKQRAYFREAAAGKAYVSGFLVGLVSRNPGVYFSRPVLGPGDFVLGVVMIKLDGKFIRTVVGNVGIGREGFAILDEQVLPGRWVVLAHRNPERLYTCGKPLTDEQVRKIDPQWRWGRATIPIHPVAILKDGVKERTFRAEQDGEVYLVAIEEMETVPWAVIVAQPDEEFRAKVWVIAGDEAITVLLVLAFACALALYQSHSILKPVRRLTATAERIAAGDLDARANIETTDEIGRLAGVFDRMVPQLRDNLKLQQSLALAADVQAELLPQQAPSFPGLDVAGKSLSYEQIGGDYFDFIDLRPWDDPRLAITVGDICGHGIAAAMLMATARAHVRSRAQPLPDLGELLKGVNRRLAVDLGVDKFMTLGFYVLDPARKRVDWASAGQDAAFHYRAATGEIEEVAAKGVPLGVMDDWDYVALSRDDLAPGDVFLLGTDGIWETRNAAKEEFDKERVRALLRGHHDRTAQEIVDVVLAALETFRGDLPRQDDVTIVVARVV